MLAFPNEFKPTLNPAASYRSKLSYGRPFKAAIVMQPHGHPHAHHALRLWVTQLS